jgi:hypothetical protein
MSPRRSDDPDGKKELLAKRECSFHSSADRNFSGRRDEEKIGSAMVRRIVRVPNCDLAGRMRLWAAVTGRNRWRLPYSDACPLRRADLSTRYFEECGSLGQADSRREDTHLNINRGAVCVETLALLRWPKPGRAGPTRSDAYQIRRASSVNASATRAEGGTSVPRS